MQIFIFRLLKVLQKTYSFHLYLKFISKLCPIILSYRKTRGIFLGYQYVFKRIEKKYVLTQNKYEKIIEGILPHTLFPI